MAGKPSFTAAVKKAIFASQICGAFPYTLDATRFRLTVIRTVYLLFVLVLMTAFFMYTVLTGERGFLNNNFEWNITLLKSGMLITTSSGTMIAMLFVGDKLNCWMEAAFKSQDAMSAYLQTSFSCRRWDSLIHCTLCLVLFVVEVNLYDSFAYVKMTWECYIGIMIVVSFINQFVGMVDLLKQAFLEINRTFSKTTLDKLEAAVIAFERLTTASEELNDAYGTQLLVVVGGNFLLATTNAFLIVNEPVPSRKIIFACQCAIVAWSPFRLVQACVSLVNESKQFNILLSSVLVEEKSYGLAESSRLRLHLSMKKEIEFTARGFFPLDYGLINAMLGAVTTYLVILIQFDESSTN